MKKIVYILIFFMALTSCLKDEDLIKTEVQEQGSSSIAMNEVLAKATDGPDWIELYNSSDQSIDIAGFSIADPGAEYVFETGTNISGKGYLVVFCDKGNTVDADGTIHTTFKISAGGEKLTLKDKDSKLVDEIDLPALEVDMAYGRTSDGADEWQKMSPTKGAANSTENNPPNLGADTIIGVNNKEAFVYRVTASDADGIRNVKIVLKETTSQIIEMAPIGVGEYEVSLPIYEAGKTVEYYIVATDETGLKTYFPETAPGTMLSFVVSDAPASYEDLTLEASYDLSLTDASGLSFTAGNTSLYTISDKATEIYEISFEGSLISTINTTASDMEGICFYDGNIWVAEEGNLNILKLGTDGSLVSTTNIDITTNDPNKGLEGLTVNPDNGHFYCVNEANPGLLIELNENLQKLNEYSLSFAPDYSGVYYDKGKLWIVSDEAGTVTKCDLEGNAEIAYRLGIEKAEGIVVDSDNGILYIVSDSENKLYKYSFETKPLEQLVINEIHGKGDPEDYIELYNGTSSAIDISGYKLQDSDPLDIFTIPASTTIEAGGFYVLICDGNGGDNANFKIGKSGEDITLFDASDNIVDQLLEVKWPAATVEGLVGREEDAATKWIGLAAPSMGASNN